VEVSHQLPNLAGFLATNSARTARANRWEYHYTASCADLASLPHLILFYNYLYSSVGHPEQSLKVREIKIKEIIQCCDIKTMKILKV
jgi:hypothetical protein